MERDPTNANRLYVSVERVGVFRNDDITNPNSLWTNVSNNNNALRNSILAFGNNNIEMSVANNGRVYVGVIRDGQLVFIGFSDDQGVFWSQMDLPLTDEGGTDFGLTNVANGTPAAVGAAGFNNFSILADPNNPETVYVGGDGQPT